jgi:hypothetical protein
MKEGDAVRVRMPGHRRRLRGVVVGRLPALVRVRVGLRVVEVFPDAVQVVRRRGEREIILARDRALRAEVATLAGRLQGRRGVI